jgi:hypothetical protein
VSNYVYKGPGPHSDPVIGLVRPGDVRQFDEEPDWGPWQLLSEAFTEASDAVLTADELAELKKEADAGLAAPSPFPTAPKEM